MKTSFVALATFLLATVVSGMAAPSPEARLAELGLSLPAPATAIANYVPAVRTGNLVFLAGQIARGPDGKFLVGKVGREVTEAEATAAARTCALQLLAALKVEVGDLRKVKRIVRVGGFVNCTDTFTNQPKVINGCSDLLVAVFGDQGRHARAAVGVNALPAGAPVEIDLVAEVTD
ncbi:MAG TPA: RidA family protein [Opitutaceae bacterium]|nr:RidA family protein [Opitutaceae bacterium]